MIKEIIKYLLCLFIGLSSSFNNSSPSYVQSKDYFFVLDIPKIKLEEKVYSYNDNNNDVDKGIYLAKKYDFKTLSGSLILASHSGNSSISYFKNLNQLKKNDIVKVVLDDRIIYYKIVNKYKINKNGKFKYTNNDGLIYLITCDKKNSKKQIVIQGKITKITKKSSFF